MSHYIIDPDEYETIVDSRPCTRCGGELGPCRGIGCNGSFSIGSKRRSPEDIARLRAERQRNKEDAILAMAEAIKAQRAALP